MFGFGQKKLFENVILDFRKVWHYIYFRNFVAQMMNLLIEKIIRLIDRRKLVLESLFCMLVVWFIYLFIYLFMHDMFRHHNVWVRVEITLEGLCCRLWKCILMCVTILMQPDQNVIRLLTDSVLGSVRGWAGGVRGWGGAEPSSRVSRLPAVCLHAELQILEESHRPERMQYVSTPVCRLFSVGACLWALLSGWCV